MIIFEIQSSQLLLVVIVEHVLIMSTRHFAVCDIFHHADMSSAERRLVLRRCLELPSAQPFSSPPYPRSERQHNKHKSLSNQQKCLSRATIHSTVLSFEPTFLLLTSLQSPLHKILPGYSSFRISPFLSHAF